MSSERKGIGFSVSAELHEQFKVAAAAEERTIKGSLINFMKQRVAEHKAEEADLESISGKAA
jgi:hypothetical protein